MAPMALDMAGRQNTQAALVTDLSPSVGEHTRLRRLCPIVRDGYRSEVEHRISSSGEWLIVLRCRRKHASCFHLALVGVAIEVVLSCAALFPARGCSTPSSEYSHCKCEYRSAPCKNDLISSS